MHLITEQLNHYQLSKFFIFLHRLIESSPPYLKNWRGPRPSLLTGEIGVCRRSFPGQIKQQAGSPKVKRRNRRTPAWQMKLYLGYLHATLPLHLQPWKCMGAREWLFPFSWCMCMSLQFVTKKRYSNALKKCVNKVFDRRKKTDIVTKYCNTTPPL